MFYSLAHVLTFLAQVNLSARLSYSSFEATMLRAMCEHSNNNCKPRGGSIKNSVSHANIQFAQIATKEKQNLGTIILWLQSYF